MSVPPSHPGPDFAPMPGPGQPATAQPQPAVPATAAGPGQWGGGQPPTGGPPPPPAPPAFAPPPLPAPAAPLTPEEAARWRSGGRFVMGAAIAVFLAGIAIIVVAIAFTVLARQVSPEAPGGLVALFVGMGVVVALPALVLGIAQFLLGKARSVLAVIPIGILSLVGAASVLGDLRSLAEGRFTTSDALALGCWAAVLATSWYGWAIYRPLAGRPRPD